MAASPSSGVNTVTGEGLGKALPGAQVVVDVANAPSWEDQAVLAFFETSGRNLLAAESIAGLGIMWRCRSSASERLFASGYFRAKMAQENLIKASPIPYTIVPRHAVLRVRGRHRPIGDRGQTVRLPPVLMQPIAADDVAATWRTRPSVTVERHGRSRRSRTDPSRRHSCGDFWTQPGTYGR